MNRTHQPRCLVLLAAYNGRRFIAEQVESILMQEGVDVTLCVSVDASTDGTELWFNDLARKDVRVALLPHGQTFGGAARNFFRLMKDVDFEAFDYVAFADQDDIWFPEKLLRAHRVLSDRNAAGYSSNFEAYWPSGRRLLVEKSQQQKPWDFLFESAGPGCTYVMRKDLAGAVQAAVRSQWSEIQDVGFHDWFAYAFARANGYKWIIDEQPTMLYRQHEANQIGVNTGLRAFAHRARTVLNGWGLWQAALIAKLVGIESHTFVRRWSAGQRAGLLWLAFRSTQCRRRSRDVVLFAISCLVLSVTKGRK